VPGRPGTELLSANLGGTANFGGKPFRRCLLLGRSSATRAYLLLQDAPRRPNKHESQNWKAYNATFDQSFLNDRLAFQVRLTTSLHHGRRRLDDRSEYEINVDINATYADERPIECGTALCGNGASQPGLNTSETRVRDVFRFTPTASFVRQTSSATPRWPRSLASRISPDCMRGIKSPTRTFISPSCGHPQYPRQFEQRSGISPPLRVNWSRTAALNGSLSRAQHAQ